MAPRGALIPTVVTVLVLAIVAGSAVRARAWSTSLVRSRSARTGPVRRSSPPVAMMSTTPGPLAAAATTVPGSTIEPTAVATVGPLREADALVTLPSSAGSGVLARLSALPNVKAVELVDAGRLEVQGAPAVTVGVDPSSFRNFMPPATARANQVWQYIAGGALASSFEMARDRKLALGAMLSVAPMAPGGPDQRWLGALVSTGVPGIDMVVSRALGATLHLVPNAEAIVSAPAADPTALQAAITRLVPGSKVELIRPEAPLGGSAGASLTWNEQSKVISAALSRVGLPYVWGATGPNAFDCSGLVRWSFAAGGIVMPRTAAEQARTGPRVPLNQVQPGDLLFWAYDANDPTFIDHVAMYLGGDMMVVAPETGQLVQVTRVPTNHLVGAIRVNVIR